MPLIKSASKEAFSSNVAAERNAGKPEAQSVAIAYAVQRRARRRAPSLSDVQKRRRARPEKE